MILLQLDNELGICLGDREVGFGVTWHCLEAYCLHLWLQKFQFFKIPQLYNIICWLEYCKKKSAHYAQIGVTVKGAVYIDVIVPATVKVVHH